MGKALKITESGATLVIDSDNYQLVRGRSNAFREHQSAQELRFSRTRGARHQNMWAVTGQVDADGAAIFVAPDRWQRDAAAPVRCDCLGRQRERFFGSGYWRAASPMAYKRFRCRFADRCGPERFAAGGTGGQ
jgi:hypothetical protein